MSEINFNVKSSSKIDDDFITDDSLDDILGIKDRKHGRSSRVFERVKLKPLNDEQRADLVKKLNYVIVQDYNDDYNLSEEERKEKNKYYQVFSKYLKCRKKYKKIPEYVKAMRLALDCVDVVSLNNGIYNPVEFTSKVLAGKIKITGLTFPKYIGKDRKYINKDYLWKLILDKSREPSEYEDVDEDEVIGYIPDDNELEKKGGVVYYEDSYEATDKDAVEELSYKESKSFFNHNPEILSTVAGIIKSKNKRMHSRYKQNAFVYDLTNVDFEYIDQMDTKRKLKAKGSIPEFTGDILDKKAYKKYLKRLDEYEDNNIKVNYEGKMRSQNEIDEIEMKNAFDENGWDLRKFWGNSSKHDKYVKAYKKSKRREEKLKEKLTKATNMKDKMKEKKKRSKKGKK